MTRRKPAEITDAPEFRVIPLDRIETRDDDSDDNILHLSGYASTFEPYEMYGGPAAGGWIEQISRNAFDKTLNEKPDLHLLVNHEGWSLARTKSGTLQLMVDDHGLRVDAQLDRSDPDVQRLEPKMRRKDMDEMSFAFRVKAQEWRSLPDFPDDDMALRTITEVSLHKGDVSVVNFGANPTTSASVRSVEEALKVLAECDESQLAEVRSADVLRAVEKLSPNAQDVTAWLAAEEAHNLRSWLEAEQAYHDDVRAWLDAEKEHRTPGVHIEVFNVVDVLRSNLAKLLGVEELSDDMISAIRAALSPPEVSAADSDRLRLARALLD